MIELISKELLNWYILGKEKVSLRAAEVE